MSDEYTDTVLSLVYCKGCRTKFEASQQNYAANGQPYCERCHPDKPKPEEPPHEERTEGIAGRDDGEPQVIADLPKDFVVLGCHVYDLVPRGDRCDHQQQHVYDKLTNNKSNFCMECGSRLRRMKKGG